MAVSGGAQALAAVREGLERLRSSLADAGLDLGDVALRADAAPSASASSSASSFASSPGSGGTDGQGSTSAPDGRADSSRSGDHRPGRQQDGPADAVPGATQPVPSTRQRPGSPLGIQAPSGQDPTRPRRLDVRV
jgi:hypothetical protein